MPKQDSKNGFTLMNPTSERSERAFTLMNPTSESKTKGFTLVNEMQKAFTLIELIIAISIIAILASLIFGSFANSQKLTRNTQRKSDLSQYRSSLESFANAGSSGLFPVKTTAVEASTSLCTALSLTGCPEDPKSAISTYKYCSSTTGTSYVMWSTLEDATSSMWVICSDGKSNTSPTIPTCGASFNCNLP